MKTKQSVASRVLEVLNTQGGKTPKQINEILGVKSNSVYTALAQLKAKKKIARDEDGVYITQDKPLSVERPTVHPKIKKMYSSPQAKNNTIKNLENEVIKLNDWCLEWRKKYEEMEKVKDLINEKYLDAKAVIVYLESKLLK
jgi:predicted ArsR family transcriptional regulator